MKYYKKGQEAYWKKIQDQSNTFEVKHQYVHIERKPHCLIAKIAAATLIACGIFLFVVFTYAITTI